jgi:hypothetical protein
MSHGQTHDSDRVSQRATANEPGPNAFRMTGDAITITEDFFAEGDPQSNLRHVRNHTFEVIPAEAWKNGQRLYYQEAGQVFTAQETDAFVGFAQRNAPDTGDVLNQAKKAAETSGWVTTVGAARAKGTTLSVDFALQPTLGLIAGGPASDGRYTLRDYSTEPTTLAWFSAVYLTYFGTLAAGGATIEIGTTADPDKFLTAIDFTAIMAAAVEGERKLYPLPAAATVLPGSEVVLTVSVADATTGTLRLELIATH